MDTEHEWLTHFVSGLNAEKYTPQVLNSIPALINAALVKTGIHDFHLAISAQSGKVVIIHPLINGTEH